MTVRVLRLRTVRMPPTSRRCNHMLCHAWFRHRHWRGWRRRQPGLHRAPGPGAHGTRSGRHGHTQHVHLCHRRLGQSIDRVHVPKRYWRPRGGGSCHGTAAVAKDVRSRCVGTCRHRLHTGSAGNRTFAAAFSATTRATFASLPAECTSGSNCTAYADGVSPALYVPRAGVCAACGPRTLA